MEKERKKLTTSVCVIACVIALMLVVTPAVRQTTVGTLVSEQVEEECSVCGKSVGDDTVEICTIVAIGAPIVIEGIGNGEYDFESGFDGNSQNYMYDVGLGSGLQSAPKGDGAPKGNLQNIPSNDGINELIVERLEELQTICDAGYPYDFPDWLPDGIQKVALCLAVAITPILGLEITYSIVSVWITGTVQFSLILFAFGIFGGIHDLCMDIFHTCMELL